jgi:uncharacterized paraquat-inducible protein A
VGVSVLANLLKALWRFIPGNLLSKMGNYDVAECQDNKSLTRHSHERPASAAVSCLLVIAFTITASFTKKEFIGGLLR